MRNQYFRESAFLELMTRDVYFPPHGHVYQTTRVNLAVCVIVSFATIYNSLYRCTTAVPAWSILK